MYAPSVSFVIVTSDSIRGLPSGGGGKGAMIYNDTKCDNMLKDNIKIIYNDIIPCPIMICKEIQMPGLVIM